MVRRILAFAVLAVCGTTTLLSQQLPNYPDKPVAFSIGHPTAQHVILISIDGMHALDLANYVAAGEWQSRAGGDAIQGLGAALVERVEGDYLNVVGLPASLLVRLLAERFAGTYGFG